MQISCDIVDLRVFLGIIDLRSFNKAAEALNLSQPAISRRLQNLELSIGTKLIERNTRSIGLTKAGRTLEPKVRKFIAELDEAVDLARNSERVVAEQITLSCIPTASPYIVPDLLARCAVELPNVNVRVLELPSADGLRAVSEGDADFGINLSDTVDDGLRFTALIDDPYLLVCRPDHPLNGDRPVTWQDLQDYPVIWLNLKSGNRNVLDRALAASPVRLKVSYEFNQPSMILALVARNLGISVLPRLATLTHQSIDVISRPLYGPRVVRTIGLIERRSSRHSPALKLFREILTDICNRCSDDLVEKNL